MIQGWARALARLSERPPSIIRRVVALVLGGLMFLGLIPWLLVRLVDGVSERIAAAPPRAVELGIGVASAFVGLVIIAWVTLVQWRIGRGTPAPPAPTQHLVVDGPYRYSRNPIEFGIILYYFGFGTLIASSITGALTSLVMAVLLSAYHKFVEEKELLLRYGEEYREYRDRTPFLIPRIRRRSRSDRENSAER